MSGRLKDPALVQLTTCVCVCVCVCVEQEPREELTADADRNSCTYIIIGVLRNSKNMTVVRGV